MMKMVWNENSRLLHSEADGMERLGAMELLRNTKMLDIVGLVEESEKAFSRKTMRRLGSLLSQLRDVRVNLKFIGRVCHKARGRFHYALL